MVNFVKKLVINMKLSIEFEVTIVTLCDIKRKVADAITKLIHFDFLYDGIFFFFFTSLRALPDRNDKSSGKLKIQPRGSGFQFQKQL